MIGLLRGQVSDSGDGTLLVDVGGVGYEVSAPLGTLGRLTADAEGLATLWVHTHVREDAFVLYGFATLAERQAFRALNSVVKVGPKLALAALGALGVGELAAAVGAGDVARLAKVPGVGRKTAERLVLELKDKLTLPAGPTPVALPRPAGQATVLQEALVRMGFRPAEAERAVASLGDFDRPLGELVRDALAVLAR
ncbi:MAG: Holliday junction branch migration protein RuvA [Myxococcales bacterium]|nr:Holliday junction branch migration protein RuvA [Myxococcales bacterium]